MTFPVLAHVRACWRCRLARALDLHPRWLCDRGRRLFFRILGGRIR